MTWVGPNICEETWQVAVKQKADVNDIYVCSMLTMNL